MNRSFKGESFKISINGKNSGINIEPDITQKESPGWRAIEVRDAASKYLGREFGHNQPLDMSFNVVDPDTGVSTEYSLVDMLTKFHLMMLNVQ